MWRILAFFLIPFVAWGQGAHPILPIGSPAPDFSLPGADGKTHALADYASSPILVVIFTCAITARLRGCTSAACSSSLRTIATKE
jgi:peroxiredoxin